MDPYFLETDVNECGADNGGCEHFCRNEAGTHSCYCRVGYVLNADGIHCDGTLLVISFLSFDFHSTNMEV